MDNSYTVIRRFTPPTCTLEIWGKNSPLSLWTKKTIIKDLQFKLSFDDPRNLDTEPIIITGDRDKLEQLYNAVLNYTENFLEQSFLARSVASIGTNNTNSIDKDRPYLTSQGLVYHQLNLGNLTTNKNELQILLSASQLFDLVSALDDYQSAMLVLAELENRETKKSRKIIPLGLSVAGILLAVGLTAVGIQYNNRSKIQEQITATQESESQVAIEPPQEDVIPPEVPKVVPKPITTIKEDARISSQEKLPPPPAVDTPKPRPDIPDPAKYPPSGNLTIPPLASSLPKPANIPEIAEPKANENPDNSQVESTIAVTPEVTESTPKKEATNIENNSETTELEIAAEATESISELDNSDRNNTLPTFTEAEPSEIKISGENTNINPESIPRSRQNSVFSKRELLEDNSEINDNNIALDSATPKPTTEESNVIENELNSKIPQNTQLQEVKSYFQQKWQIPDGLKQTLEYRLIIARDGSIKRIVPIGKASEIYLDRTNIPLMGEAFISPISDRESMTIRLLLSPDGEVATFLE